MSKKLEVEKVNDDFSYISKADGKTYTMSVKERLFADYYLTFKGDGIQAVYEAGYNPKNSLVASAISYQNLRKPHILAYVNSKLEEYGFNDENVTRQHLFLLNQHADLKTKAKAIDMHYKLKGSYAPEKSQSINLDVKIDATDPKAKALAEEYEEKLRLSML